MSPELGMHNAMFTVLILPPLLFVLTLIGGIVAGFVAHRFFESQPAIIKLNRGFLGLICVGAVLLSCSALFSMPPLGELFPTLTYVKLFFTCALVAFWSGSRK